MLTISDESAFALSNQKGWDKLEASMDPFKLLKAITRLHFISYNDNQATMEEDVYDKLDDMRQGTHEALGVYTARFKDCVAAFGAIGLNTPDELELLRKYRKSLDKSRYSKLLEELKLDVESEIIQPMESRLQLYKYLIRRVPDTVYSTPDVKLGTVFAMESKSKHKNVQKSRPRMANLLTHVINALIQFQTRIRCIGDATVPISLSLDNGKTSKIRRSPPSRKRSSKSS